MSCDEISKESSGINNTIFNGYKIRVGYHTWPEDLERIKTAISYNTTPHFMIDAIMGTIRPSLLPTDWINRIRDIRDLNIEWLEEPLSPDNFSSVADLRCMTKTPLAFGEAVTGKYELMSYINSPHLDVLQLDFTHLGGPSLFLDVYSDIIATNKTISMHVWGSPLAFNVNSYLGSLIPNCSWTEYPSVSLGINEKLCFSYYNREPDLLAVQALIGFAPSTFGDMVFSAYPFVPGTSFSWKPK
jgi:L-alanine-DL-glutamate epimerase-like enolase superfamily enzyme